MSDSSQTLHEDESKLQPETLERHRAFVSLIEELEAADWYDQRVDATADESLAAILAHNRDEEKEHAAMVLEWLRRRDPALDAHLREFLFTEGDIAHHEEDEAGAAAGSGAAPGDGSLGVGSLREEVDK